MATISKTFTNGSFTATLEYKENSTSTANNTSNITATLKVSSNSYGSFYGYTTSGTISINGTNYNVSTTANLGTSSTITVGSKTVNVGHNADGSKSINIGFSVSNGFAGSASNSTSWTLTKINRYAVTNSASGSDIEDNFSVNYTKYVNDYKYKLRVSIPGIKTEETIDYNTSNQPFALSQATKDDLYERFTTVNSFSLGFRVETWNSAGTSRLSEGNEKTITARITNANPTFDVSYLDTNSVTTAITNDNQQIIRNNSTLRINVTNAAALKNASLSSAKVVLNGVTYNGTFGSGNSVTFDIGTVNISENIIAEVSVTDSRGNTTVKNLPITILDWQLPTAIIILQRHNNFYSSTDINVDADYSSLDDKNAITIKVRTKKVSDSTYGPYTTLQDSITSVLNLDNNYQWNVQILIQDRVGATTYNLTLDRGIPIVFYDRVKRSVGINCFPQNNESLEVLGGDILQILGMKTTTWSSSDTYSIGDIVVYNSKLYENLTGVNSGVPSSDTTNWQLTSILVED